MAIISNYAMHKLLRLKGAKRISRNAEKRFAEYLENVGLKIALKAVTLAKHAGRNTVLDRDIELAAKEVLKENI